MTRGLLLPARVGILRGMNRLLFGDNLKWLSDRKPLRAVCRSTAIFPDESVDREYLDPPFNSNTNYNVLFKEASGADSQAQLVIQTRYEYQGYNRKV